MSSQRMLTRCFKGCFWDALGLIDAADRSAPKEHQGADGGSTPHSSAFGGASPPGARVGDCMRVSDCMVVSDSMLVSDFMAVTNSMCVWT